MEYIQGLQIKSEQELSKNNRCFNEFLSYSQREQYYGDRNKHFQSEAICLKRNLNNFTEKFNNLPTIQLKHNGFGKRSKGKIDSFMSDVKRQNMRRVDLESISDEEHFQGFDDIENHRENHREITNDYRFMNERGLNRRRPDMTRSLSCNVDRDVILSRWPRDNYIQSYSCATKQVSY
jgi:hypothetical protein